MRFAIRNGTVQIVDTVFNDLVWNVLRFGLKFVQSHPRDFRINECGSGNNGVIDLEFFECSEERIDSGIPRLMRSHVGELIGASHVTSGKNVRVERLQVLVGIDCAAGGHANIFQTKAFEASRTSHGANQLVIFQRNFLAFEFHHQMFFATLGFAAQRFVIAEHIHAICTQCVKCMLRHFVIFSNQQAWRHFDLRDLAAQSRKSLRQLRANRPAAQHHHTRWHIIEFGKGIPKGIARDIADFFDSRKWRNEGARARCDHDAARGEHLFTAIVHGDFNRPWVHNFCVTSKAFDAQAGVALRRIMRLNRGNHIMHTLHHGFEAKAGRGVDQAIVARRAHLLGDFCRFDDCFAGHAAVIEAIATHLVRFDQGDFCFHSRRNVSRHQAACAAAYHHQVAVKAFWFDVIPLCIDLAFFQRCNDLFSNDGEDAE